MSSPLSWPSSSSWSASSLSLKSGPRKAKPLTFQARAKSRAAPVKTVHSAHQELKFLLSRAHLQQKTAPNKSVVKHNRSAQLIGVKTLLYLVLAVATILLAVMLLSRIYNAVLGGDPAAQDAKLLAQVANDMLRDDRPYIQVPLLIRLDEQRIVGFEQGGGQDIVVPKDDCDPKAGSIDRIDVKNGCIGKACICSSNDDKTKNCYNLEVPEGKTLLLRGNYQSYASCLPPERGVDTSQLPEDIRGAYTNLVIDKNAVKYLELVDKSKGVTVAQNEKKPNAILPMIVEKITSGDSVAIVVSPDSDRVRGRVFYLYTCPKENSAEGCEGETGASSITTGKEGEQKYCAPSLTTKGCTYQTIVSCNIQCGITNEPCLCGAATEPEKKGVATYGLCVNDRAHVAVNCEAITKCEDYPLQDGDPTITQAESWSCSFDACNVAPPGMQCQFGAPTIEGMDGFWNRIKGTFNEDALNEQCTPARQSQVRARLSCDDK